jgi:hypothetical protein
MSVVSRAWSTAPMRGISRRTGSVRWAWQAAAKRSAWRTRKGATVVRTGRRVDRLGGQGQSVEAAGHRFVGGGQALLPARVVTGRERRGQRRPDLGGGGELGEGCAEPLVVGRVAPLEQEAQPHHVAGETTSTEKAAARSKPEMKGSGTAHEGRDRQSGASRGIRRNLIRVSTLGRQPEAEGSRRP